jgi:hypothetical protein
MATTVLFQPPQGGTGIQASQTDHIVTGLDISNVKNLRITYKHSNGAGSVTVTVKIIHEAAGANANIVLATLDTVVVNNLQTISKVYPNIVGRRLSIDATASPQTSPTTAGESLILIVLGDT